MPVEALLTGDSDTLQIAYDEIKTIEMERSGIPIITNTAMYSFDFQQKEDFEINYGLLRSVVGEKLDIRS